MNSKHSELLNRIYELENENKELREFKNHTTIFLEQNKTLFLVSEVETIKVIWSSNNRYFKDLLGEHLPNCEDIFDLRFLKFIHPEDKLNVLQNALSFTSNNTDEVSFCFRAPKSDSTLITFLVNITVCNYLKPGINLCLGQISTDNNNSTKENNETLGNHKSGKKNLIDKYNFDNEELTIIRYLKQGNFRKDLLDFMGFKTIKEIDNKMTKIFIKANVHKLTELLDKLDKEGFFNSN